MYKIAVMGDKASVYGFAALGLEIYPVTEPQEAINRLKQLADGNYAVIYITEQLAELIPEELSRLNKQPLPAVIPIPGVYGNTGMGMKTVQENIIKAVGSEII